MTDANHLKKLEILANQRIKEKNYWLAQLSAPTRVFFPYDYSGSKGDKFEKIDIGFSPELILKLKTGSNDSHQKMYIYLAAALVTLIYIYTGNRDIIIGSPIFKQTGKGGLINTVLALRNRVQEDMTFKDLLIQIKQTIIEAVKNQNYPLEILSRQLDLPVSPGGDFPFFDISILLKNIHDQTDIRTVRHNMKFTFWRDEDDVEGVVEYNALLYEKTTVEQIVSRFRRLLSELLNDIDKRLFNIDILTGKEKEQLLYEFNETKVDYPKNSTIHQLFEAEAARRPDKVAVVSIGHGQTSNERGSAESARGGFILHSTYKEINRKADQMAALLRLKGIKKEEAVGIVAEHSPGMIVGLLAILKAGGAYLPINPGYPVKRQVYLVKDANIKLLLTNQRQEYGYFPGVVHLALESVNLYNIPSHDDYREENRFDSLAYIIYTSGSTGKPKGVMVEHRNVIRLVKNTNYLQFISADRILQTGALEFDASTFEIWGALLNGPGLYLAPRDVVLIPEKLEDSIRRYDIGTMWMTSALFTQMVDEAPDIFKGLRNLLVGGDVLSPPHINRVRRRFPGLNIINGYGPTENTTFSTTYAIDKEYDRRIPIGKPIANSTAYIIDRDANLSPVGVKGELVVGGDGIARGYLNNPELTVEKFTMFQPEAGEVPFRIYRTGDLCGWLPDGNIEFWGRLDHQVKIRGFRIEPGEIENCLLTHEKIKEAVVVVTSGGRKGEFNEQGEDKYICAYFVSEEELLIADLKDYLSRYLSDYMIPSYFVTMEKLPLTPHGKIDRKALPLPEIRASGEYAAARNTVEKVLVGLWAQVLNTKRIGIDDNFFEMGGHSLKATILAARIQKVLDVRIPLSEIFRTPTIRELGQYINNVPKERYRSLSPVEEKEYYGLSSAQKRLYILQQMDLESTAYNIPGAVPLGTPDLERLQSSFKKLIGRHESLRTSFHMVDEEPVQKIHHEVEFEIQEMTGAGSFIRPFDLSQAPLLRAALLKVDGDKYRLLVDMHHIISDGISHGILEGDFMEFFLGEEPGPLPLQYKDFAEWQNKEKQKETLRNQEIYWLKEFEGEVPVLNLPLDYPRPAVQGFEGDDLAFELGSAETAELKELALKEGVTLYMVLVSVFNVLLSRLGSQEDIVIGTPIAGRRHADLEKVIGMFVNTLALRNYPTGNISFKEFLGNVKEGVLEAFENQEYPFEELVEKVQIVRDAGRNPLFDVMFVLQNLGEIPKAVNMNPPVVNQPDRNGEYGTFSDNGTAKFDLTLTAVEVGDKLALSFNYCTRLFKPESIKRFVNYFYRIIGLVVREAGMRISEIDIIWGKEKERLLYDFNAAQADYPVDKTIHELFAEQAARTPEGVAVVGGRHNTLTIGKRERVEEIVQITYGELHKRSAQTAHLLRQKGVQPDIIVGIMMRRSIDMVIAIMGILKAGGAYLPIDPGYPRERIDYMLKDSGAELVVTSLSEGRPFDFPSSSLPHFPASRLSNLIYTIYTSGSTGRPKGACVYHRGFTNLVNWYIREFNLDISDRVLLVTSLSFDLTQKNIFTPLCIGGVLYILPGQHFEPDVILGEVWRNQLTWINCTPGMFYRLIDEEEGFEQLSSLRYVFLGGEPIMLPMLRRWLESRYCRGELVNTYGPTECTDVCSYYRLPRCGSDLPLPETVPIGQGVYNTRLFILDRCNRPVPIGVAGELCIGGDGVGPGYLNHSEMTLERFQTVSFGRGRDENIYRTGDLAKRLSDGNIEFLGRMDQQVKIRGFRIELGEIESHLLKKEEIAEAVVTARESGGGDNCLCAYVVGAFPGLPGSLELSELKRYLSASLPDYMIPSYFIQLERIPLNPNGKVDRRALPAPDVRGVGNEYIAPATPIEERLAKIWSDVLETGKEVASTDESPGQPLLPIGIDDGFFELGGHSLNAVIMLSRVHKAFNVRIPLIEVFKKPTIRGLAQFILSAEEDKYISIEPVEEKEYYGLSSAQKRLYILQQMELNTTVYNMPQTISLSADFDLEKMGRVFTGLIKRHESLRTSFLMIDEEPVQSIHDVDELGFLIDYYDTSRDQATEVMQNFVRPFDLSQAPLLRVGVIRVGAAPRLLLIDMHHIITDGISQEILEKEFLTLYAGKELTPLRLRYKDFSQWQNSSRQQELIKKQEAYWVNLFSDETPVLNLPTDYPRPLVQSFEGSDLGFELGSEETRELKELSLKEGATLYMIVLSIFNVLLSKLSNQEDIIVGTPIAGRRHADLEKVIGMFVNTLVLRNYPTGNISFKEFLGNVKEGVLEAFENQEYPFEELVEKVQVVRDTGRNPLFDVLFSLPHMGDQNRDIPEVEIVGAKATPLDMENRTSKFDMTLTLIGGRKRLLFSLQYCTKLFKRVTIERFIGYFKNIVFLVTGEPEMKIRQIEVMSEEERKQVLLDFNDIHREYPGDKTIHRLFEEQAARTPGHMAVIGVEQLHITYHELNKKANQLAFNLKGKGVGPDTIAAIMMERSVEMIIVIMGILKSGGVYLPIDPNYPTERIDYMLRDSGAGILLTSSDLSNYQPSMNSAGAHFHHSGNLAYIIYTSGSTGRPRGVLVEHGSVVNLLQVLQKKYPFSPGDTYLFKTSVVFDVSVTELFGWFLGGGRLAVLEKKAEKDPYKILNTIERWYVTHINFVPSMFGAFLEILDSGTIAKLSCLKYIFLAGEALLPGLVRKFKGLNPGVVLENIYGPTETTVYVSRYSLSEWQGAGSIPIGKPLPNMQLYILDKYDRIQPMGVIGELCIGGAGLGRGYLNRPGLTAEKFDQDLWDYQDYQDEKSKQTIKQKFFGGSRGAIFQKSPPGRRRLYKTGDLARWLPDGNIEFLGRIDYQVKIRGFRVELGEIESVLSNHSEIHESIVVESADESGDNYLCAYIISSVELELSVLREYLAVALPDYMIPSHFVFLEKFPLTPSGKVNRRVLPVPEPVAREAYIAPRDAFEERLSEIWSEVLGVKKSIIGINTNFFNLGGHSLKAMILAARIHKELDIKIPLAEMFKKPYIRGLHQYIAGVGKDKYAAIPVVEAKEYYALSSAQKRLYILQGVELNSTAYNMFRAISLSGESDLEKLEGTFVKLIERHESLRTSFLMIDEEPVQRVHDVDGLEISIEYYDSRDDDQIAEIIENFIRFFDLSQAPLLRVGVVKTGTVPRLLLVDMHHIITDGISQEILEKEFLALYAGEELSSLRFQYKDFSQWQNSGQQQELIKQQEAYWVNLFPDEIPVLNLPTDYPRPPVQSFEGNDLGFELGSDETRELNELALKEGATLYMILLSIFNVLLSKLSSQEDIIVGTPVAGRRHADLEKIIGMFVNTLALRNYPAVEKTFRQFLREVKERTLAVFENQEYQFEDLVDRVAVERDAARNPLFDVMFVLQNLIEPSITGDVAEPGKETTGRDAEKVEPEADEYRYNDRAAKFDMTLVGWEAGDSLRFIFQYCTKLFKKETIERFIAYFKRIVLAVVEEPQRKISEIEIIPPEEKHRLIYEFNGPEIEYPEGKTIHQLFEEQAKRTPDSVSIVGSWQLAVGKGERIVEVVQLTYRELNKKADQLEFILNKKGVGPDTIAAIMMEQSIEMIVGILGILKVGGAYLPIDPDYPEERKQYMLADSSARILLKKSEIRISKHETNPNDRNSNDQNKISTPIVLNFEHLDFEFVSNFEFRTSNLRPSGLAYVIYTSGSTGRPRGVGVEHRSAVNTLLCRRTEYKMSRGDIALQLFSYAFDGFVTSFFTPVISGAAVALLSGPGVKDITRIKEAIINYRITHFISIPVLFQAIIEELTEGETVSLKEVTLAGDKVSPYLVKLARGKNKNIVITNEYGVTESAVMSTIYRNQEEDAIIKIGAPVWNTRIYILDKYRELQPAGIPGELCIAGVGLARGYLNNPGLTAEKFIFLGNHEATKDTKEHEENNEKLLRGVQAPRRGEPKKAICVAPNALRPAPCALLSPPGRQRQKLYSTGDLARWLSDGNIEFLGRIDYQVKIRGFRIELGEIENRLNNHSEIREAVVMARSDETGDKYLCAYIVSSREFALPQLQEYLGKDLPDYMVPGYFVSLEQMPLTPNGKVDLRALPLPGIGSGDEYTAPGDEMEETLVEIWSEVLGVEKDIISINSSFFKLGGHSLKAAIMAAKIQIQCKVNVPLLELFKTPTIRGLAGYIKAAKEKRTIFVKDESLVLLRESPGKGNYLFFIHDGSGEVEGYIEFCKNLGNEFSCWGIRADRYDTYAPKNLTVREIAAKYIEKIKKLQFTGPYFIAGWSVGGTIAFEMVNQLEQMGEEVAFFALIDSPSPRQANSMEDAQTFTLDTERNFIRKYLSESEREKILESVTDMDNFWLHIVEYLETEDFDVQLIKKFVTEYEAHIVPNYHGLGIGQLVKYLNVGRMFHNTRAQYRPDRKIHTPVHYFAAARSKEIIINEYWNEHCRQPISSYQVPGDHYSILQIPDVLKFAKLFRKMIEKNRLPAFPGNKRSEKGKSQRNDFSKKVD